MTPNIFFLLFLSTMLLSCNCKNGNKRSNLQNQNTKQDTIPVKDTGDVTKSQAQNTRLGSPYIMVTQEKEIEIRTVSKKLDTTSKFFKVYIEKCNDWKLNKKDILNILRSSKEIDGQEFHHYYDVLPCYYSGSVSIDGKIASYEINAGAFTTLFFKDTSVYLGYTKDDFKKYFLIGPGVD